MESAGHGCLATADATGAQATERGAQATERFKSGTPSVFHAFLGAICERPLKLLQSVCIEFI